MKKFLALLLVTLALSASPLALADMAPEPDVFTDVHDGDVDYWAIRWMDEEGIVQGYTDGSYLPDANINRAEFSKIVSLAADLDRAPQTDNSDMFSDLEGNEWYFIYVLGLYQHGVIGGYDDGTFRPGNFVNYAEACKMIARAYDYEPTETYGEWYEPYTDWVEAMGGKPDSIGTNYGASITRGEMALMIYGVANNL